MVLQSLVNCHVSLNQAVHGNSYGDRGDDGELEDVKQFL